MRPGFMYKKLFIHHLCPVKVNSWSSIVNGQYFLQRFIKYLLHVVYKPVTTLRDTKLWVIRSLVLFFICCFTVYCYCDLAYLSYCVVLGSIEEMGFRQIVYTYHFSLPKCSLAEQAQYFIVILVCKKILQRKLRKRRPKTFLIKKKQKN